MCQILVPEQVPKEVERGLRKADGKTSGYGGRAMLCVLEDYLTRLIPIPFGLAAAASNCPVTMQLLEHYDVYF